MPATPKKMTLSIIIPTIGRSTLARTLASLLGQLNAYDEVILVHDGPIDDGICKMLVDTHVVREGLSTQELDEWWCLDGKGVTYHVVQLNYGPCHDWGATARNIGMNRAKGDHILFIDDDDCYAPNALDVVRNAVNNDPQSMFLFQMRCKDGQILWRDQDLRCGNVGTPMFCFPRNFRYNKWESGNTHDFQFIDDVVRLNPDHTLVWLPQVIAFIQH